MGKMKLKIVGLLGVLFFTGLSVVAQESETFTDEELTKYASVMKWAELETAALSQKVADLVNNNENLSASAYNTLSRAQKAGEDLRATDVAETEIVEFEKVSATTESLKEEFNGIYKDKILSDIGASLYNSLKKALRSDEEVKTRYEAIYNSLPSETTEDTNP
jgi:hypothetical protein